MTAEVQPYLVPLVLYGALKLPAAPASPPTPTPTPTTTPPTPLRPRVRFAACVNSPAGDFHNFGAEKQRQTQRQKAQNAECEISGA